MDTGELVLLSPGPACTSERVRRALGRGDMCHREAEFRDVLLSTRAAVPRALGLAGTHEAVLLAGSGTAAMEMAVIGAVRTGRALLVVDNGVYGDRLAQIGLAHGIAVRRVMGDWTRPADPERVAAELARHPDVDAVACVHHETTAGLINPIAAIGHVAARAGALFLVDAISGCAIEDQDLALVGADLICGTSNKGLHGLPGVSFLLLSERAERRLAEVPSRSLYLAASTYLARQRVGDVPFTPAVQPCFALREAIAEYEEAGGFAARTADYRRRAALVRSGFHAMDLEILVADPDRANSVTALRLPAGVGYDRLHDALKRRGFVIYAGPGPLARSCFRVATMGHLDLTTLERFLEALSGVLGDLRGSVP